MVEVTVFPPGIDGYVAQRLAYKLWFIKADYFFSIQSVFLILCTPKSVQYDGKNNLEQETLAFNLSFH